MTRRRHVRHIKRLAKKPLFTIPLATFMVLLVVGMVGLLVLNGGTPKLHTSDSNIVILNYDHNMQTVPTRARTVGELLQKLNIHLNSGDVVEPSSATRIIGDNFRINVYRAVPVTIIDGIQKTFAYSAASTPRSIVKQAGIQVYPEDDLTLLPTQNFLTDSSIGERVVIDRATPIIVSLYGTPVTLRTHAKTVAELLKDKNITLHNGDTVDPVASTVLTADSQVFVNHKGEKIVSEEQDVPMPIQTVEDDSLTFGTTAIRQQGSVGKKIITFQVELQNGVEVGRKEIQEVVTQQPVTQIIAKGAAVQIPSDKQAVMRLAGISPSDYAYVDYIASHEGGWCPTKIQGTYSCPQYMTASEVPSYGGYGIFQATPGSKMASAGSDWVTSAVTQIRWATGYADSRYGSWAAAYAHWQAHSNW